jgi:Protein of unknown function (DUF3376)
LRRESDRYWAGPHAAQSGAAASGWQDRFGKRLGDFADALAGLLVDLRARLVPVEGQAAADLRNALDTLVTGPPPGLAPLGRGEVVRRLLALDVVQRSAGADLAGVEQRIELVLVSADAARNAFRAGAPVEHKLAGLQAGHFGAFYKQSWRANDWMWGRLDGADRLVRTLVDPKRLQPMPPQERFDRVRAIACGGEHAEYLESQWEDEPVRTELDGDLKDDAKLEATYAALARRVQLEIVMEELPRVRLAVEGDVDAGGARGKGADWAARHPGELDAARAVQAFKVCDVGAETLPGEVGSDQFTRVSTQGIAVAGSFLSTSVPAKPPKLVAALLATVRGALLALYLLAKGVLMRTRSAGFAAQAVLAAGAVLLALALLGAGIPGIFAVIGAVLIVDGFALAALQRQGWRILLVLLAFAVAVGGYYGIREWSGRPAVVDSLAAVVAVGIMALAAMTLGLAARSKASPADSSDASSAS